MKPENISVATLQKLLSRAYHSSSLDREGAIVVTDGLAGCVAIHVDAKRKFVRLSSWIKLSHLDIADIATESCRLNDAFLLVKFIARKNMIVMHYELPYAEGLNPRTFIRLLRRFAKISAEASATLPKPMTDLRSLERPQRLHS